jgi:predicted metal-dependent enzyme (double-stranded beta helix superfamily)
MGVDPTVYLESDSSSGPTAAAIVAVRWPDDRRERSSVTDGPDGAIMGDVFDIDDFVQSCRDCLEETEPRRAIRETVARAVSDPASVRAALRSEQAGISFLHRSDELTVLHVVWAPGMQLFPHDHRMWACIGIHDGREDNQFFRRAGQGGGLVDSGGKRLDETDVVLLGDDTVHSVTNPLRSPTGAIHVYGGDFVAQPRSQWVPPTLIEEPYDVDRVNRVFADANDAWHAAGTTPTGS